MGAIVPARSGARFKASGIACAEGVVMGKEEWLAVDLKTDRIVAEGSSIAEVTDKAKAEGVKEPYVTQVLPNDTEMFF